MEKDLDRNFRVGKSGLVIYDGSCGVCNFFVEKRRSFFEKYNFTLAPLQEEWVPDLVHLERDVLLKSIHVLTPRGEVFRGAEFFQYVSGQIWYLKPVHWALRISFVRFVFNKCYDYIAKRRMTISRSCKLS